MRYFLVVLMLWPSLVFGQSFNGWQISNYKTVPFGVGMGATCPIEKRELGEHFFDVLTEKGFEVIIWDYTRPGFYIRVECNEASNPRGWTYYMSVSWIWSQGGDAPSIELIDYYGFTRSLQYVRDYAKEMSSESVDIYLQKSSPTPERQTSKIP